MQDAPTSPARHHLKLANAYLDEVMLANKSKTVSSADLKLQLNSLSKAAENLVIARDIEPHETLLFRKDKEDFEIDQDRMNSLVLSCEGIVSVNNARIAHLEFEDYKQDSSTNGGAIRAKARQGIQYLNDARTAFEKSLKYWPDNPDALCFLSETYRNLGDRENYGRILKRRADIDPDDMAAQKELDQLDEFPGSLFNHDDLATTVFLWFVALLIIAIPLWLWSRF